MKRTRVFAAVAIFVILLLIFPLRVLTPGEFNASSRLIYDNRYYTHAFLTKGQYATGIWHGQGKEITSISFRARIQTAQVPEDTRLQVYLMDEAGRRVLDESIHIFPFPEEGVYTIPVSLLLTDGEDYQFVISLPDEAVVGIECWDKTSEPVVIRHTDEARVERAGMELTVTLYAAAWAFGVLFILVLLFVGSRPDRPVLGVDGNLITLNVAATKIIAALLCSAMSIQYLTDHAAESAFALRLGIAVTVLFLALCVMEILHVSRMKMMALLLLIGGLSFVFLMPPGMAPDETNHFYRAFELSCGNIFARMVGEAGAPGDYLPAALAGFRDASARIDWNNVQPFSFPNTALYSPVCYLPQMLGIKLVRTFTDHVQTVFYAGRLASFAGAYVLSVGALKKMPFGRELLFTVMMLPITLQEMGSLTSDAFVNALVFFFLACVLDMAERGEKLKIKELLLLILLCAAIALCKIVYIVVILMILLIPAASFAEGRKGKLLRAALLICPVGANLGYSALMRGYLQEYIEGVDAVAQIRFVLQNPLEAGFIFLRSVFLGGDRWFASMTTDALGQLDIETAPILTFLALALLVYVTMDTIYSDRLASRAKLALSLFAVTGLMGCLLVMASMYATWTPVGQSHLLVIQGRYFTAFLPFMLFAVVGFRTMRGHVQHKKGTGYLLRTWLVDYLLLMNLTIVLWDVFRYQIIAGMLP